MTVDSRAHVRASIEEPSAGDGVNSFCEYWLSSLRHVHNASTSKDTSCPQRNQRPHPFVDRPGQTIMRAVAVGASPWGHVPTGPREGCRVHVEERDLMRSRHRMGHLILTLKIGPVVRSAHVVPCQIRKGPRQRIFEEMA